jgi:hypothetical protein
MKNGGGKHPQLRVLPLAFPLTLSLNLLNAACGPKQEITISPDEHGSRQRFARDRTSRDAVEPGRSMYVNGRRPSSFPL